MENRNSPAKPAQGLDALAAFIREYLICDDHQLTILTLWIANTWCFSGFQSAPYLDIRSPLPQSGKSVCLKLLWVLARDTSLITAGASHTIFKRLLNHRSVTFLEENRENPERPRSAGTFLIDDCHHSLGPSERQALIALLNCGSDATSVYSHGDDQYFVTSPKAFAGNASLPQSLASRCIPIVLRRSKASEPVKRLFIEEIENPTEILRQWLQDWSEENSGCLQEARHKPVQFPSALTPRQQLCAEPLLRIANLMGGSWPARARAALAQAFGAAECSDSVQLLRDVRTLFFQSNQPEELPTRNLLSYLRGLETRPWSNWGSKSGQRLAALLHTFGIFSHDIRVNGDSLKGYSFRDFQDAWQRYAGLVAENAAAQENAAAG